MEIEWPKECIVLSAQLGMEAPPCEKLCVKETFPSYRDGDGKMQGCWVAHTALTVIESVRLKSRLGKALEKRGVNWHVVEDLAILHDVGKLSEAYIEWKRPMQHNVFSWAIALTLYRDLTIPTTILLHHEAMHWRDLYRKRLSFFQQLRATINMKPIIEGFKLHERCDDTLNALKIVLRDLKLERKILDDILGVRVYRAKLEDLNRCLRWGKHLSMALKLYWILYLADNRAASARDGLEAYWLNLLKKFSEISEEPLKLTDCILKKIRRVDIALTALPIA